MEKRSAVSVAGPHERDEVLLDEGGFRPRQLSLRLRKTGR